MDNILLYSKLTSLPENMKSEVSDFIDFLITKSKKNYPGKKPKFGIGKGMFKMKKNFDQPIEDFKDYI
jgi:Protein of unknown function (DUF2281)